MRANLFAMATTTTFLGALAVGVNGLMGRHFEAGLQNLKKVAEQ